MTAFDLNTLGESVSIGGREARVVRSVRTANGVRVTLDIPDVDATNAQDIDASKVVVGLSRTTGPVTQPKPSDADASRDADQNAAGATPNEVPAELAENDGVAEDESTVEDPR